MSGVNGVTICKLRGMSVLGSETTVLRQDWSQTSHSFGLGLTILVLVLYFWPS